MSELIQKDREKKKVKVTTYLYADDWLWATDHPMGQVSASMALRLVFNKWVQEQQMKVRASSREINLTLPEEEATNG